MSEVTNNEKGHFAANWPFYAVIIAALLFAGYLGLSKNQALKKQTKAFATEKSEYVEQAQNAFQANTKEQMELMMKTFVWSVRGEMIRGNQEQVDQYFTQLVKVDNIEEIALVDNDGTTIISTNKKNEGMKYSGESSEAILKSDQVSTFKVGEMQNVVAPVLTIDSKLGTLIVTYKLKSFE